MVRAIPSGRAFVLRTVAVPVAAVPASVPSAVQFEGRFHGKGLKTSRRSGAEGRQTMRLRRLLVKDQQGRCAFCRRRMTPSMRGRAKDTAETLEHVMPRALGGALCASNCVAACHSCNQYRHWQMTGRVDFYERVIHLLRRLSGWAEVTAQAIEARRAETGTGSVHESAVANGHAPKEAGHGG